MKTLLVTASGGAISENLSRAIRASGIPVRIIGTNITPYFLARSSADKKYLVPRARDAADYLRAIRGIVGRERVDLIVPCHDVEVTVLSRRREQLGCPLLLARHEMVEICQDKLTLNRKLRSLGLTVAATHPVTSADVDGLFATAGEAGLVWCRMRRSWGSRGSLPVRNRKQLDAWVAYWREMRGASRADFLACEYLPGRDFALQSLWHRGSLVIAKTCERLTYLAGDWMPSGTSSTPQLGRLVNNPAVNEVCAAAVQGIDHEASGIYCIDLKENRHGRPCITEINIGRFFTISPVFNLVGRYNMAELFLRVAFGQEVMVDHDHRFSDIGDEDTYLIREFDGPPLMVPLRQIEASCEAWK